MDKNAHKIDTFGTKIGTYWYLFMFKSYTIIIISQQTFVEIPKHKSRS